MGTPDPPSRHAGLPVTPGRPRVVIAHAPAPATAADGPAFDGPSPDRGPGAAAPAMGDDVVTVILDDVVSVILDDGITVIFDDERAVTRGGADRRGTPGATGGTTAARPAEEQQPVAPPPIGPASCSDAARRLADRLDGYRRHSPRPIAAELVRTPEADVAPR